MRTLLAALAAILYLLTPAYAFPAHNPSWVDHPDIPNCTLTGPNSYENNPGCETYVRMPNGGQSMVSHVSSGGGGQCSGILLPEFEACFEGDTEFGCSGGQVWDSLRDTCANAGPDICAPGFDWNGTRCEAGETADPCDYPNVRHVITGRCLEPALPLPNDP
ncbi:MAG: hypothetical protein ABL879_13320 [Devosia sp.]